MISKRISHADFCVSSCVMRPVIHAKKAQPMRGSGVQGLGVEVRGWVLGCSASLCDVHEEGAASQGYEA